MNRRPTRPLLLAYLLLAGTAPLSAQHAVTSPGITAADALARVTYLASDALAGRFTPSPGLDSAAAYIAREFERLALEPVDGAYIRPYPLLSYRSADDVTLTLGSATVRHGADFFLLPTPVESLDGQMVLLGALTDAPFTAPTDVPGCVAAFYLEGTPGREWEARAGRGLRAAQGAGARAVVLIMDRAVTPELVQGIARSLDRERRGGSDLPIIAVRYDAIAPMLVAAGMTHDALVGMTIEPQRSIALGPIQLRQPLHRNETTPPNVIGLLRGSDPRLRDEYVVVTAHFDHVGIGTPADGDSIYNGADDNASGTTGLLELAEAFAALPQPPARSILFVAVSGEELGLLGVRHFVAEPPVALASVVANINLDMIGRNAPDTVGVVGQHLSTLGAVVTQQATSHPELRLFPAADPWPGIPAQRLLRMSDQLAFLEHQVPALFFTTVGHPELHHPSDQVELLDADKMARVASLAFHTIHAVADAPERPRWTAAPWQ